MGEEGEARDVMVQGFEAYALNKVLSVMAGEKVVKDFAALGAGDWAGQWALFDSFLSTNVFEVFESTPSGALIAGSNPRIMHVGKTFANIFGTDTELDTWEAIKIQATAVASLSSGFSNYKRASYLIEAGETMDRFGNTTEDATPFVSGLAALFGFRDIDEAMKYYVADELYKKDAAYAEDNKKTVDNLFQFAAQMGFTDKDDERLGHVLKGVLNIKDPLHRSDVMSIVQSRTRGGDLRVYEAAMRMMTRGQTDGLDKLINVWADPAQQKALRNYKSELDKMEAN
jgi:hypothetical protein